MKRAQISIDTFILLAVLLVMAIAILLIVFPAVKYKILEQSEAGLCEWSLVMHSISKLGDWSLIPPECRAHRIEITMGHLELHKTEAKERIKTYHNPKTRAKYTDDIRAAYPNPDKDIYWQEWALNKMIAEEMKNCWQKVFKGRLPLFNQWWKLYSFPWEEKKITDGPAAFKFFAGEVLQAPVNCIVCSRIKFGDNVKRKFGASTTIDSLDVWLKNNYPRFGGESYYEILTEGQSELKGLFVPKYEFSMDEPLAVLYEKIHYYHGADKFLTGAWDYLISDLPDKAELDYLKLVPYTQERIVGKPVLTGGQYEGEACTFILD
jgi:hypothetical protein